MDASTPRLRGVLLRLAESSLRATPLSRLLSHLMIERKLRGIDFAAEGEPSPYFAPRSWTRGR